MIQAGVSAPSISTPSNSTVPQAIKLAYGQSLARELLHLPLYQDYVLEFQAEGWLTGANWNSKKPQGNFLAFINRSSRAVYASDFRDPRLLYLSQSVLCWSAQIDRWTLRD